VLDDAFGGSDSLNDNLKTIADEGRGVVVYLREGSVGVASGGMRGDVDESPRNEPAFGDEREDHGTAQSRKEEWLEIGLGAQILKDLGVSSIRLLASKERLYVGLSGFGIEIGEVAILENAEVYAAWYTQPTTRYAHGILGDAIEAGELTVETSTGDTLTYTLPENQVFEDRTPRLVDLDGFGKTQIITILSDQTKGGSIAVFGVRKGKLELVAQTPYIGRSNRWLNIAGIDDFDGDGKTQIAAVWTPHIGGTLKYWTWDKGKLSISGEAYGFSNHFIGSREQELSTVNDFNGNGVSDLALPSADRKAVRIMTFKGPARGKKVLEIVAH